MQKRNVTEGDYCEIITAPIVTKYSKQLVDDIIDNLYDDDDDDDDDDC